jgi:hypothetical protein
MKHRKFDDKLEEDDRKKKKNTSFPKINSQDFRQSRLKNSSKN